MIENSSNQNKIFENTKIDKIESKQDHFIAITNYGYKIKCKKIILATGFNWEVLVLSDLCERFVSYSIVTKPVKGLSYYKKSLVHNMQSPYNHMRMLPDGGIIFGGEDVAWNIKKGIVAKQAEKKYKNLEKSLKKLFPNFSDKLEISHKFCGAFGTTNNNLGIIDESETKNLYYFISCGSNGIINAMFGVELLEDLFVGKTNPLAPIFSPLRADL